MTFAAAQVASAGSRVTTGLATTSAYGSNNGSGNLLISITAKSTTGNNSMPTIGTVTDTRGNKWKQAVEGGFVQNSGFVYWMNQSLDIWIAEQSIAGANTLTQTCLGFPVTGVINGMQSVGLEYSGATGFQLMEAVGFNQGTSAATFSVSTNFGVSTSHELQVAAIITDASVVNLSAASLAAGWVLAASEGTQGLYIAHLLDSGTATGVQSVSWALVGATQNAGAICCFTPTGVSSSSPHILQSSYQEQLHGSNTTQAFSVNPTPGNTLFCILYQGPAFIPSLTDVAANYWVPVTNYVTGTLQDTDWALWMCKSCVGGTTQMSIPPGITNGAVQSILFEVGGVAMPLTLDQWAANKATSITTGSVLSGDFAIGKSSDLFATAVPTPAAGWQILFSDTAGVGYMQVYPNTPSGALTLANNVASNWGNQVWAMTQQTVASPSFGTH